VLIAQRLPQGFLAARAQGSRSEFQGLAKNMKASLQFLQDKFQVAIVGNLTACNHAPDAVGWECTLCRDVYASSIYLD
jgi:hypothetical protein